MSKLTLYVVGARSPNPDDWSEWGEWSLVIAENPERAMELAHEAASGIPIEVNMSSPARLIHHSSAPST
jgi:hypothetical protein